MAVLLEWLTALLEYFDLNFCTIANHCKIYLNTFDQFLETSETRLDPPLVCSENRFCELHPGHNGGGILTEELEIKGVVVYYCHIISLLVTGHMQPSNHQRDTLPIGHVCTEHSHAAQCEWVEITHTQ